MKATKYVIGILSILAIGLGLGWFFNDMNDFTNGVMADAQTKKPIRMVQIDQDSEVTDPKISDLTGIYEYVYEHNTDNLIENHYLEFKNGKGYYYGTSDDFDEAREGYYPGFFMSEISSLDLNRNVLKFSVEVNDSSFYKKAITPIYQTNGNEPWEIGIRYDSRNYTGEINGDTIIVMTKDFDPRLFIKKRIN